MMLTKGPMTLSWERSLPFQEQGARSQRMVNTLISHLFFQGGIARAPGYPSLTNLDQVEGQGQALLVNQELFQKEFEHEGK